MALKVTASEFVVTPPNKRRFQKIKDPTEIIRFTDSYDEISGKTVRTVNPPVYSGSTVLFETYEDLHQANSGEYGGITYGTVRYLESDFSQAE